MYGYNNPQFSVDRINQQIAELERLKNNYQQMPQAPVQNIINTNTSQIDFEAQYISENDKVEDLIVQRRTAFICLKNGTLKIKELNGDIETYQIIKPKTLEQLKIEELERKLNEYEQRFNSTNNEVIKSTTNIDEPNDDTTTKTNSREFSKKS